MAGRSTEGNGHPDRNPYSYSCLIFHKNGKNTYCRKHRLYQQMVLVKPELTICRRMKLDPSLSFCTKINSEWIKDLNVRPETGGARGNMAWSTCRQKLPERTSVAQERTPRTDKKWEYTKSHSFCTATVTVKGRGGLQNTRKPLHIWQKHLKYTKNSMKRWETKQPTL